MTLSGYFMLKCVFGQQVCRVLTCALARLCCLLLKYCHPALWVALYKLSPWL